MKHFLISCAVIGFLLSGSAKAQDSYFDDDQGYGLDYFSLSVGAFETFNDETALDLRAEYRPDITYLGLFKPYFGIEATSDFSVWAGAGLLVDHEFSPNWYVTPSLGAGLYNQGSSDLNLDYPVQFRSQIEVSYQYDSGHRAGLAFSHLSNAGLGDDNPGANVLGFYWHIPY